jgi:cytochrome c556
MAREGVQEKMKHPQNRSIHTSLAKGDWRGFLLRTFLIVMIFQSMNGFAPAAETIHKHSPAPKMGSQHNSMSIINKQWQACKKCLEVEDFEGAGASLSRMQKAANNLAKYRPHKNVEKKGDLREQSDNFKNNLSALGKAIKEKDKARAQSLSQAIDNSCLQCHSVFR